MAWFLSVEEIIYCIYCVYVYLSDYDVYFISYTIVTQEFFETIQQKKQDPKAGFNIETLLVCILDLIEAGTETAATTLRWGIVFMLNYPEIQG